MFNHAQLTEVCPSLVVTSLGLSPGMGHLLFLIMIFLALHVLDRQVSTDHTPSLLCITRHKSNVVSVA